MVDISTALTIASQAIGVAKSIREINQGFDAAEYKGKIAELLTSIAEMQVALIDARE